MTIKPGRAWAGHTAGQYVRIGVDVDGVRQWRAYSLTSAAGSADRCFSITVKAIPDGLVSNHLVRFARPGTIVQLDRAVGDFVLPAQRPAKALFVTAGSGITPVMGMLRTHDLSDVVVVHSAPTGADVIFGAELRAMAESGRITLIEKHTDVDGMLDASALADLAPDLAERETWACGPSGLLDALDAHLLTPGWLIDCTSNVSVPTCWSPAREAPSHSPAPTRPSMRTAARPCSTQGKPPAS